MARAIWIFRILCLLGGSILIYTILLLIPTLNASQRFYKFSEDFLSINKIRLERKLPEVEILPLPIKPSFVEPSTNSIKENLPNEKLDQWLRRFYSEPKEKIEHSKHKYFQRTLISNDKLCYNSAVDILVYIQSSPENYERRRAIRESWGNGAIFRDIYLKIVFVVGRSNNKESKHKIQAIVTNENIQYNDILMFDFLDTFNNLTLKSISTLNWIYHFCPQAKYILKTDDDIYVNIFQLIENFISQMWDKEKAIVCHYKNNGTSPIIRTPSSKWYVPENIFKGKRYFPFGFCSGYAILFTSNILPEMYKQSLQIPYIIIDDVYAFGLLLKDIKNITIINVHRNFTLDQNAALSEYEGSRPITHVVASAWAQNSMSRFWYATIRRLSAWGKLHSRLSTK